MTTNAFLIKGFLLKYTGDGDYDTLAESLNLLSDTLDGGWYICAVHREYDTLDMGDHGVYLTQINNVVGLRQDNGAAMTPSDVVELRDLLANPGSETVSEETLIMLKDVFLSHDEDKDWTLPRVGDKSRVYVDYFDVDRKYDLYNLSSVYT
jgi:hypothetical protein